MADQLSNGMSGMSLNESQHAPSGQHAPGPNGFHPERSAYIPPHIRNSQARAPAPMNGSAGPGGPGGPGDPGLGQSQWASK